MKQVKLALSAVVLAMVASLANAAPMTWSDSLNFENKLLSPSARSFIYEHNISDSFIPGDVAANIITAFDLEIGLADDQRRDGKERGIIRVEGIKVDKIKKVKNSSAFEYKFSLSDALMPTKFGEAAFRGLFTLNEFGVLGVQVTAKRGDFYLVDSKLTAYGSSNVVVSEPATLALLGLGIVGLGLARRQQKSA